MNCLLIAATVLEIRPFLDLYRSANHRLEGIDILVTGIGLTASTYSLTRQLLTKTPGLVIQAGIAGCFDKSIPLGTVFVVKKDRIADLGVIEKGQFNSVFKMGLVPASRFPYKDGWLDNGSAVLKKTKLKKINAISVNTISSTKQQIDVYRNEHDPVLESMEGAALHYVCLKEKIPFLQLRAASNYIGERNKRNWKLKESIENLNQELLLLLTKL